MDAVTTTTTTMMITTTPTHPKLNHQLHQQRQPRRQPFNHDDLFHYKYNDYSDFCNYNNRRQLQQLPQPPTTTTTFSTWMLKGSSLTVFQCSV